MFSPLPPPSRGIPAVALLTSQVGESHHALLIYRQLLQALPFFLKEGNQDISKVYTPSSPNQAAENTNALIAVTFFVHIMCRVDAFLMSARKINLLVEARLAAETHSAVTAFSRAWPFTSKPIVLWRKSQRVIIVTRCQS